MAESFHSQEELNLVFETFLSQAGIDPIAVTFLANVDHIVRMSLADPDTEITIHLGDPKTAKKGILLTFEMTPKTPAEAHKPAEAVLSMPAEIAHRFWLGSENLGQAVIDGKIKVSGNYIKALALLPAVRPFFRIYRETLKELGLDRLIPAESV